MFKFLIPLLFSSCTLMRMYPDSYIEETLEDYIQAQTNVKIDFTGDSPEKQK